MGTTGTVETGGARLYYEARGEGRPVVLLHDGLLDRRIWDDQFVTLSGRYRTVRYDARGHGESGATGGEFSHVEDLRALLDSLGIGRAHLVGASNGGRISLDFALEHPGRVGSLVLVGPGLSGYRDSDEKRRRISGIFSAKEEGADRWAASWLDDPFWSPDPGNAAARRKLRGLLIDAFHGFSRAPDARERRNRDAPAIERLSEVGVPTLVIVGERDDPDNRAIAEMLASGIGGAEKVVMPGVAHLPGVENPDDFDRLVLRFLEGL